MEPRLPMPKTKRSRKVPTSTRERKEVLLDSIREAVQQFQNIYVFSVTCMRTAFLQEVRAYFKGRGKFFMGKNKVMAKAFGASSSDEPVPGIHVLGDLLKGQVGIFLTNDSADVVKKVFSEYEKNTYARTGSMAMSTVVIPKGNVLKNGEPFPHTLESQLRSLGMPTRLMKGIVTVDRDFQICAKGETITSEQGRLLKLFDFEMDIFSINITHCFNSSEGLRKFV